MMNTLPSNTEEAKNCEEHGGSGRFGVLPRRTMGPAWHWDRSVPRPHGTDRRCDVTPEETRRKRGKAVGDHVGSANLELFDAI